MLPDAPTGHAWSCPDCEYMAATGLNAGFHMSETGHRSPSLKRLPMAGIQKLTADNGQYQQTIETLSGYVQRLSRSRNDLQKNCIQLRALLEELKEILTEVNEAMNTCYDHTDASMRVVSQSFDSFKIGNAHLKVRSALQKEGK